MTDRFNGMPDQAAMTMRGAHSFAYEAAQAARIIGIVRIKDKTSDPVKRAQRAAILKVAESILIDFANREVEDALEARDWFRQLREQTDGNDSANTDAGSQDGNTQGGS